MSRVREVGGCWEWGGGSEVRVEGRQVRPVRGAWMMWRGEPPSGRLPWHRCGNRGCVRPGHVEWITRQEWVRRYLKPPFRKKEKQNEDGAAIGK